MSAQQLVSNVRTFPLRFGSVRLDNIDTIDLSLIKNVSIYKSATAQFRLEAVNAFNHPQFPGPNITPTRKRLARLSRRRRRTIRAASRRW